MSTGIRTLLACCLGAFFMLAGGLKLGDPAAFAQSILHYQLVGEGLAWWGALYLPWLEVMLGAALLFPRWRRSSAQILGALTTFFIVVLASTIWRGLDVSCGCLGGSDSTSAELAILRNLVILIGLVCVMGSSINRSQA